jgi:hypothetical protein
MFSRATAGIAVGLLIATVFLSTSPAFGQGGFLCAPGGYGLGFYDYTNANLNHQQLPYFALFPPVYYSYPVARSYGYSPFAYPPGTVTPEVAPGPVEFINPYVPQPVEPKPASDRVTLGKTYYNPFVQQARTAGNASIERGSQ